jgi:hypothetical protein
LTTPEYETASAARISRAMAARKPDANLITEAVEIRVPASVVMGPTVRYGDLADRMGYNGAGVLDRFLGLIPGLDRLC